MKKALNIFAVFAVFSILIYSIAAQAQLTRKKVKILRSPSSPSVQVEGKEIESPNVSKTVKAGGVTTGFGAKQTVLMTPLQLFNQNCQMSFKDARMQLRWDKIRENLPSAGGGGGGLGGAIEHLGSIIVCEGEGDGDGGDAGAGDDIEKSLEEEIEAARDNLAGYKLGEWMGAGKAAEGGVATEDLKAALDAYAYSGGSAIHGYYTDGAGNKYFYSVDSNGNVTVCLVEKGGSSKSGDGGGKKKS